MIIRIITHRLNKWKYGDLIEEDSSRIKCLLENGEAEVYEDFKGDEGPVLAPVPEEVPQEEVKSAPELPAKKKAGRPKKIK